MLTTPPPKQKPTAPSLPVQSGRDFSHAAAARKSSLILLRSTSVKSFAPFSSSPGYPPADVSPSGANARKFAIGQSSRHIFYVRIETAVLVHDQNPGQFSSRIRRVHHVAVDGPVALWRWHGHRLSLDAAVAFRNLCRPSIIRSEHLEEGCRGYAADRKLFCAVKKLAPMNFAMHVSVE